MNENTGVHLNRQAVIRWQMGEATESERSHMENCAACQAEAKPLKDALHWFGAAAREWGEQKAAFSREWGSERVARVRTAAVISWRVLVGAGAAVTLALLVIFGIGLPHEKSQAPANQADVQQQHAGQAQQQEIASDNALLDEVDQDVSQEVPAALQPLSWSATSSTARQ
jgi:hypothetical protein